MNDENMRQMDMGDNTKDNSKKFEESSDDECLDICKDEDFMSITIGDNNV